MKYCKLIEISCLLLGKTRLSAGFHFKKNKIRLNIIMKYRIIIKILIINLLIKTIISVPFKKTWVLESKIIVRSTSRLEVEILGIYYDLAI